MYWHVLLYIKQGLKARRRVFSPIIIIEDQYLQTFIHTLNISQPARFLTDKSGSVQYYQVVHPHAP